MQSFPHHYHVSASAQPEGEVSLSADRLETLFSAPPVEFGGPGNRWSPESLLVAAVADCFILSFRSIAAASKLPWLALACQVEGVLERVDGVTKFTHFVLNAELQVSADIAPEKAQRLLEKAEQVCLISNSLSGSKEVHARITVVP